MDGRSTSQGAGAWPAMFLLEHVAGLQPRFGSHGFMRLAPQSIVSNLVVNWCGNELIWKSNPKGFHLTAAFPQSIPVEFVLPFVPESVQAITLKNGQELPVKHRTTFPDCKKLEIQIVLG